MENLDTTQTTSLRQQLKKTKWVLVAVSIFILCLFVPLSAHSARFLIFGIAAIVIGFFVFLEMLKIDDLSDVFYIKDGQINKRATNVVFPAICAILSFIILVSIYGHKVDMAIKNKGLITSGIIVDGERVVSQSVRRRSETNKLYVQFTDSLGRTRKMQTSVSNNIYRSVYKGAEVRLKYLPEHPNLFKILVDENVRTFTGISNRNLMLKDIEQIFALPIDSIINYLQTISEGWKMNEVEGSRIFENKLKNETVLFTNEGQIILNGGVTAQPEQFIPRNKILNKKTDVRRDITEYIILTLTTYELENMNVLHLLGVPKKGGGVEISMIFTEIELKQ
jgi:hypothetical protein